MQAGVKKKVCQKQLKQNRIEGEKNVYMMSDIE